MPGMTNTKTKDLDPLAPRVEEFLLLAGWSATRFGYTAAGDPALVKKMRDGRHFGAKVAARIEAVLSQKGE